MYNLTAAVENSLAVLQKLNIDSPYDPAIPLLGTDPRELKAMIKKNLHMNLQQRCLQEQKGSNNPNVHQQMNGQAECGGSTGRNKVVTYDTTWMHLDNIMLSEESQREMVSYCMKCSE